MKNGRPLCLCLVGLLAAALGRAADAPAPGAASPDPSATPPAAETQSPPPIIFSVAPPETDGNTPTIRRRAISDSLAAGLNSAIPTYAEATAPQPDPEPAPASDYVPPDDLSDEVVSMPRVVVRAERPPVFRERDLYSEDELANIALRRYAGLNVTPFDFLNRLNAPIALQMYREDERLRVMKDLTDTADAFERAGDAETGAYIRDTTNATFLRREDFGFRKTK